MGTADEGGKDVALGHGEIDSGGSEDNGVSGPEGGDHNGCGDPPSTTGEAFFRDIGCNQFGFGHDVDGQDVGIGEVHDDVDGRDDEHSNDQAARNVALRFFYFACDVGEFVPAVIGPESALKSGGDADEESGAV